MAADSMLGSISWARLVRHVGAHLLRQPPQIVSGGRLGQRADVGPETLTVPVCWMNPDEHDALARGAVMDAFHQRDAGPGRQSDVREHRIKTSPAEIVPAGLRPSRRLPA